MLALLQRVAEASVSVGGETLGAIDAGLLVFLAIERGDDEARAARLSERLLAYRVFPGQGQPMQRSVAQVAGGVLLVPQFTLAANTAKGLRPSFDAAAEPERAEWLCAHFARCLRERHEPVACGRFCAHMRVALVNDGPVTLMLRG